MLGPNGESVACTVLAIVSTGGHFSQGLPQARPTDAQHSALVIWAWTEPSHWSSITDTQHELRLVSTHTETIIMMMMMITRSSTTAERQRVSYTHLSRLTHWSCTSLTTASVLQLYNRLAKLVSTLSADKPCDMRTLSWIGHSRSFNVILIGVGRNPEWCVVIMCN